MNKHSKPSLSIAMTTYNGERFLSQQIDSIVNQTYKDFELIICDDNSTDKTVEIIKSYMKVHDNVKLYQNTSNVGFVKNFEKAISLCHQDYIALSDQDDIWLNNKLEIEMDKIKELEKKYDQLPLMVHSDLMMIDEDKNIMHKSYFKYRKYKLKDEKDLGHILGPCGVMGNTILFNRNLKEKILPFSDELEVHDYWIAVINELLGKRVTINEPLVKYVIHSNNLSNNQKNINKKSSFYEIIKKYINRDIKLPYLNSRRKSVIDYILKNYKLAKGDTLILYKFTDYLEQNKSKIILIYNIFRYSFVKRNFLYRLKIIMKIVWSK